WALKTGGTVVLGTTDLEFLQTAGSETYTPGSVLNLNGTTFSVDNTISKNTDIKDGILTLKNGYNTLGTFSANQHNNNSIYVNAIPFGESNGFAIGTGYSGDINDLDNTSYIINLSSSATNSPTTGLPGSLISVGNNGYVGMQLLSDR